jgi:hypothetical protein
VRTSFVGAAVVILGELTKLVSARIHLLDRDDPVKETGAKGTCSSSSRSRIITG